MADTGDGEDGSDSGAEEPESSEPQPPASLPNSVVGLLKSLDDQQLEDASEYATSLANWSEHDPIDFSVEDPMNAPSERVEEFLRRFYGKQEFDVHPKATFTVKEINGLEYFYWQWRDTDDGNIKSEYICPVKETPFDGRDFGSSDDADTGGAEGDSDANEDGDQGDGDDSSTAETDGGNSPTSYQSP